MVNKLQNPYDFRTYLSLLDVVSVKTIEKKITILCTSFFVKKKRTHNTSVQFFFFPISFNIEICLWDVSLA